MQALHGRVHWICSWPAAPTDVYRVSRTGNLGEKETQDEAASLSGLRPLAVHLLFLCLICYIPRCVLCSNTRLLFLVRLHSCLPPPFFLIRRCLCDTSYRLCSAAVDADAKNQVLTTCYQVYIWNRLLTLIVLMWRIG